MKYRVVRTAASDDEFVRLRIYDGVIPLQEGGAEILALAQADARRSHLAHLEVREALKALERMSLVSIAARRLRALLWRMVK